MKVNDQRSEKYRIMSEINMIPFIDVVLVLLIIFMVITPILVRSQIKIEIPVSKRGDPDKQEAQTTHVRIQKDGAITIDSGYIAPDDVEKVLGRKISDPEKHSVIIEADRNVVFQHVVTVMGAAKKLNVTKIAVKVLEERRPDSGARKTSGP